MRTVEFTLTGRMEVADLDNVNPALDLLVNGLILDRSHHAAGGAITFADFGDWWTVGDSAATYSPCELAALQAVAPAPEIPA